MSRPLRHRYGRADGTDRSVNPTVVEYAVQELFKGKSPSAAARFTAKKLSGQDNFFLGPGISVVDPKALETALWQRLVDFVVKGIPKFKEGKEHYALGSTISYFHQKPSIRPRLKQLVIGSMGRDPFVADDGT